MESLLVVFSYHHKNTEKIASAIAHVLGAGIKTPRQVTPEEVSEKRLIGFGSGIYSGKPDQSLLDLADMLPPVTGRKAFIFSTCGVPLAVSGKQFLKDYTIKCHAELREKLQSKGYEIVGEFSCAGFNTNSFLKYFGGLNKGSPNADDIRDAEEFARGLVK